MLFKSRLSYWSSDLLSHGVEYGLGHSVRDDVLTPTIGAVSSWQRCRHAEEFAVMTGGGGEGATLGGSQWGKRILA